MKSDLRFRAQHASNLHFQKPGVARLQLRVEQQWLEGKYLELLTTAEGPFAHLFDMTKIVALRSSIKIPRISNVRTRKVVCVASGRTRGFNQFTGLSRFKLKDFVERGILPGIYRASW